MKKSTGNLHSEVVDLIVESLNLHFIEKDSIAAETPLMGEGLGLDSVDILEIVVAVEQRYGVKITSADEGRQVFQTVGTIADFIARNQIAATGNTGAEQHA